MIQRKSFSLDDLEVVGHPTHEPIIVGDFVHLNSGSPLGLVISCENDVAEVSWLTGTGLRSKTPTVCLRPA